MRVSAALVTPRHPVTGLPAPERADFPLHQQVDLYGIIRPAFTERFAAIVRRYTKDILLEFLEGQCPDKRILYLMIGNKN